MNQPAMLEAIDLSHSYGTYQALAPLDLSLKAGEIAVLEGPNGSGKSTLLLCLSGMLRPSKGEVWVDGHDMASDEPAVKRAVAFVPDVPRFYLELTAWEHLHFIALTHGATEGFESRAEALMKEFGLWEGRDLFPHHYSRGMSLKLGLLLALVRPFKVLLLDEPASALDADSRQLLIQHLVDYREHGAAILLSSHDPQLKHGLADQVYTLKDGYLAQEG
jgi:ABC-2 type transport system ATP-binding protein